MLPRCGRIAATILQWDYRDRKDGKKGILDDNTEPLNKHPLQTTLPQDF